MARNGRVALALGSIIVACVVVCAGPAMAGGGGCHGVATEGTGDTVVLQDACFSPSLIHLGPGQSVTFRNEDPFAHNVIGNGWGVDGDLQPGERFTQTFEDAGIYPFACTLHPGMTGAVLVGATAQTSDVAAVTAPPSPPADEDGAAGWLLSAAAGFTIGGALVGALRRRGGTVPVPA